MENKTEMEQPVVQFPQAGPGCLSQGEETGLFELLTVGYLGLIKLQI